MIVGNGFLAYHLRNINTEAVLFCSGAASSLCQAGFERERDLLLSLPKDKKIIYTSCLDVEKSVNLYKKHKLEMEGLIKNNFDHLVFRVGNLVGSNQPTYQLIPNLLNQIKSKQVKLFTVRRDLLWIDDYAEIIKSNLNKSGIYTICSDYPPTMLEIADELQKYFCFTREIVETIESWDITPDIISGSAEYYKTVLAKVNIL